MNYYNDNDPKKAAWLRALIEDGLIPRGSVDDRSIADIQPDELRGFTQHHFFAGIGGWSLAFALAGITQDQVAASCSCPCQPFSQTGKRLGYADPRHLFPQFHRLARTLRFPRIFGEQVASSDGRVWVEGIRAEMEDLGYCFEWVDLCAAGVSAPQLRQRIYWVAYRDEDRAGEPGGTERSEAAQLQSWPYLGGCGASLRVADGVVTAPDGSCPWPNLWGIPDSHGKDHVRLGDTDSQRPQGRNLDGDRGDKWTPWQTSVALLGRDGKARRVEPSIFPLANGIPDRVGLIGGAGNAIVPLLAAEFIQACEEARHLELFGV